MWLSRQNINKEREKVANIGETTVGGSETAVYTDGETRRVNICAPGGYIWRPTLGNSLLIIKDGDGAAYAAGEKTAEPPKKFKDGEVFIKSAGGASIWLKNDGTVEISGRINIDGSLFLNGAEIS